MKVPEAFLDARVDPLTPSEKIVILNIESRGREAVYAFPSNPDLARRSGRSERAVQLILDRLEAKGYIKAVMKMSGRRFRLCFLILRRANPDRPVFTPGHDDLDAIVEAVCQKRGIPKPLYGFKNRGAMGAISSPMMGAISSPMMGEIFAPQSETFPPGRKKNQNDDRQGGSSSSSISLSQEKIPEAPSPQPREKPAQNPPRRDHEPQPDRSAIPAPRSPQGADTAVQGAIPPALIERAEKRFKVTPEKVAAAVAKFGREWVEVAVWGVPRLEQWGGVMATLRNWREEGGPDDLSKDRAREAMKPPEPIKYYRCTDPYLIAREQWLKAKTHAILTGAPIPPEPERAAPSPAVDWRAWQKELKAGGSESKTSETVAARHRLEAQELLRKAEREGHRVAVGPDGRLIWEAARPPVSEDDPTYRDGARMLRAKMERLQRLAEPIETEIVEILKVRAGEALAGAAS